MWFVMIFKILGGVAWAKLDLVFPFKVGLLWKNQSLQKMSKIWKIIKNHFKYINDSWNYILLGNLSFLAWKMRIFKIWLYDPWVQIKILHFLLSWTTEWFNQLDTEVQIWTFRPGQLISGAKWYQMPNLRPFIRLGMMLVLVWL